MGQVGPVEGIYHFALHTLAVLAAIALFPRPGGRSAGRAWFWLPPVTFVAAFIAHVAAFIILGALLGEDIDPWVHRPIVSAVWGAASGAAFYIYSRPVVRPAAVAALLTAVSYLVFVLTRHMI